MKRLSGKSMYLGLILVLLATAALVSCSTTPTPTTTTPVKTTTQVPLSTTTPASTTSAPVTTTTTKPTTTTPPTTTTTAPSVTPQSGGIFKYGITRFGPVFGYSPEIGTSTNAGEICYPCLETIVAQTRSGDFSPTGLTTALTLAPDKKSYTFTLRKGVKFHDGTPFNAEAAKWNLDAIIGSKNIAGTANFTTVNIIDDYTIRMNITAAGINDINTLAQFGGFMVSPTAVKNNGVEWARVNPVGTGPFKFKRYTPGVNYIYERFDDYWGGKPYLDEFQFIVITDSTTLSMGLQSGELDMISTSASGTIAADLKTKGFPYLAVNNVTQTYVPDSKNPSSPLANKNVRMAIDVGLNKAALAKALGSGFYTPADQMSPPGWTGWVDGLEPHTYDVNKAKQLLAEAGYAGGLKIQIIGAQGTTNQTAVEAIQQNLKEIGITVEINILTQAAFSQLESKGWTNGLLSQPLPWGEIFAYQLQRMYSSNSQFNASLLRPAGFDDAVLKALAETDGSKSSELAKQVAKTMHDEVMVIPAWYYPQLRFLRSNVHDIGFYRTTNNSFDWTPGKAWKSK